MSCRANCGEWNFCAAIMALTVIAALSYVLGFNAGYGAFP